MTGVAELKGLQAYTIDEMDSYIHMEFTSPPYGERRPVKSWVSDYLGEYFDAHGASLDPSLGGPGFFDASALLSAGNFAIRGALWMPPALQEAGVLVEDGNLLYLRRMREELQRAKNRNPYYVPIDTGRSRINMMRVVDLPSL